MKKHTRRAQDMGLVYVKLSIQVLLSTHRWKLIMYTQARPKHVPLRHPAHPCMELFLYRAEYVRTVYSALLYLSFLI